MIPGAIAILADGGHEILKELLLDYVLKVVIVVVAIAVLLIGMVVVWRRTGRSGRPRPPAG